MNNNIPQDEQKFTAENTQNRGKGSKKADNHNKKMKKAIIWTFAGMIAFILIFFILNSVLDIDNLLKKPHDGIYNPTNQTIIFYPADYDENIYKDKEYMDLDRNIYIYDIASGMTESLEKEDFLSYGNDIRFMADFISSIIEGNAEKYNSFFASSCFEKEMVQKKEAFTMQKLYNIVITKISEETGSDNYGNYTKYNLSLEYMIHKNNGTFRTDMDSDASRKQYITLAERDDKLLIENVLNVKIK